MMLFQIKQFNLFFDFIFFFKEIQILIESMRKIIFIPVVLISYLLLTSIVHAQFIPLDIISNFFKGILSFFGVTSQATQERVISTSGTIVYCDDSKPKAPVFTLNDCYGDSFSLSDFTGKVVILDFFFTMCSACTNEIPHLKDVKTEFGDNLQIIAISVYPNQDTDEKLRTYRSEHGITWILTRDTANVVDLRGDGGLYYVETGPTLYIIDQWGCKRYYHPGYTDRSVLINEINQLL
jgi:cytochrome oxidase Cu insertion factor (SCO1/SenC/PrrC family)